MIRARRARREDLRGLLALVGRAADFTPGEKKVARELIRAALEKGAASGYFLVVAREGAGGAVTGYGCLGPTPMTEGTWDFYWLLVDRAARRGGVGRLLVAAAERLARARGARRMIIDTSSQRSYLPARALYERCGYAAAAVIPDYYRPGWARVTYLKKL